jgi:hypothetical protein
MEDWAFVTVGQKYPGDFLNLPLGEQGVEYTFRDGIHKLLLIYPHIHQVELRAFKRGKAFFGLFLKDDVIHLVFKFQERDKPTVLDWSNAPYNIHLEQEPYILPLSPEKIEEGRGIPLAMALIAAETHKVIALRVTALSTEFSRRLHKEIIKQAQKTNFDLVTYHNQIDRHHMWYSPKEMYREAVVKSHS